VQTTRPRAHSGKVGLLGGSFDPPHAGHLHISRMALRRFDLGSVWWLVSPQNPLKGIPHLDFETRWRLASEMVASDAGIEPSDIEARAGFRFTVDTLDRLAGDYRNMRFIWIMGADNLAVFHRWHRWKEIFLRIPIAVFARPGFQVRAGLSLAARRFARYRIPPSQASSLIFRKPPCWSMVIGPQSDLSSARIRARDRQ